ncbi:hypothetical protein [Ohtaekwangia koreensis]|uniref:Uncharacterized protein n=1 Tax=Ohtaekwangia koreensis TaxID=688867 RepID=A0A1T5LNT2_9BACT|nr:hypothetical protein [Ohtaekwangia koreensis]SKC77636.1 hypothetical protein SAMN05660236_3616 [Ohtaekwangia koreensis]
MTVKGFIRSYGAAVRSAERDQQRRMREAAKFYRLQAKAREINDVTDAVAQYEDYIEVLQSVHKDCSDYIDWDSIMNEPPPPQPIRNSKNEDEATLILASFQPSLFDRLFGLAKDKVKKYRDAVEYAKGMDEKKYQSAADKYNEWKIMQEISKDVLAKIPAGYTRALDFFKPLNDISELGSKLELSLTSDHVTVDLFVKNDEVIPNYILTQTGTGKLSKKNMPISKFNELYQDHVCSCILRVGREILAYLPVKFVIVNAKAALLNTATGQIEDQVIISAAIPPETLVKLNFETLDPSDCLRNFIHKMKFSKITGFIAVEPIGASSISI